MAAPSAEGPGPRVGSATTPSAPVSTCGDGGPTAPDLRAEAAGGSGHPEPGTVGLQGRGGQREAWAPALRRPVR